MEITVNIPDEIAYRARANGENLSQKMLESFAIEGYREGRLTEFEVGDMLGFESPMEIDEFLKQHGAYIEYSEDEIQAQRESLCAVLPPVCK